MSTATTNDPTLAELKARARATWSAGDYDAVAERLWPAGQRVVRATKVSDGDRVLDVAAGTGNAAIRAAQAGGRVVALDLSSELFEAGQRRASEAGVEVEWLEGDAEELPFDDATFDVVLSTFGVMFAPRHAVATEEMARVLRAGGRMGLATWTTDGTVAEMFRTIGAQLPAPPEIAEPPLAWGDPDHLRQLFAETGIDLTFAAAELPADPDVDVAEAFDAYLEIFGPLIMARRALEPQGRWEALVDQLRPVMERLVREPASYLVVTGTKT